MNRRDTGVFQHVLYTPQVINFTKGGRREKTTGARGGVTEKVSERRNRRTGVTSVIRVRSGVEGRCGDRFERIGREKEEVWEER